MLTKRHHDIYHGCSTFFRRGPFSDLDLRRRAIYIIYIMKMEIFREDGKINICNIIK